MGRQSEQYQIDVFDDEEFDALEAQILQLTNFEKNQIILDSLQYLYSNLNDALQDQCTLPMLNDPCICGMLSLIDRIPLHHLITFRYLESKWNNLPTYTRIAIHSKSEYHYNLNPDGSYRFTNLKDRMNFVENLINEINTEKEKEIIEKLVTLFESKVTDKHLTINDLKDILDKISDPSLDRQELISIKLELIKKLN